MNVPTRIDKQLTNKKTDIKRKVEDREMQTLATI